MVPAKEDPEHIVAAILAEYEALRTEIQWLIEGGAKYENIALTMLVAVPAGLGWLHQGAPRLILPTLAIIPCLFVLLGYLYFRQHEEVYTVAAYIRQGIRPLLREVLSEDRLWGWEEFKNDASRSLCCPLKSITSSHTVLLLRICLFLLPAFLSLVVAAVLSCSYGVSSLVDWYGIAGAIVVGAMLVTNCALLLGFVCYLRSRGDLAGRLLGLGGDTNRPGKA